MNIFFKKIFSLGLILALIITTTPVTVAAAIQNASIAVGSHKISETTTYVFQFDLPTALGALDEVTITFPAGFDLTTAVFDSSTPGATDNIAGQVITLVFGAQTAGTTYTITVDDIVNHATPGNYTIEIASDNGDTGEITIPILNDDQVVITARVNQTLNFAVSENAVSFGDLTPSNARYATTTGGENAETTAHTLTAGTNAQAGYTISVAGDTLTSDLADTIDPIAAAVTPGIEQFGLKAEEGTVANGEIDAKYDGTYDLPASPTVAETLATNVGPTNNEVYEIFYVANIAPLTEPGNYSTTFTYTMTANF